MKRLIVSVVALALMATGAAFAQSGSNSDAAAGSNAGRQWRIEIGTGLQPLHMGFIGVSPSAELERELVRKGQFFRENDGFYPSVILTGSCELSPRWELALTASMSWGYLQLCQYDTFGIDPEGQPRYDLRSFSKLGYRNVSPVPAFTVQGRYANTAYEDAQAARKKEVKDKYQSRHGFGAEPESKERLKENKTFAEDSQIWMKLRMRMPDGIGSAIQLILDEKGITQMELAMRMGVSRTAWRKWCAEKMSLRHIVAICIALDVRADIGMELVRLAGHSFLNNKEHNILLAMMYETKDLTVARANEILRQEKLAPLTEGRDEEIAC